MLTAGREREIYAKATHPMDNTKLQTNTGGFSMRRTFLTLLGGMTAFAILTASYATADLPEPATQNGNPLIVVD